MMIWLRRGLRDVRGNLMRYLGVFALVALGLGMVIALQTSSNSVSREVHAQWEEAHLEDGEFEVHAPFTQAQEDRLSRRGITLAEQFHLDLTGPSASTVRIFTVRTSINTLKLLSGRLPAKTDEVVLEKLYAEAHAIVPGDGITLGSTPYLVSGVGVSPDFSFVIPSLASSATSPDQFGTGFMTQEGFARLAEGGSRLTYQYAYRLDAGTKNQHARDHLMEMSVNPSMLTNPALRKQVDEVVTARKDLRDGVNGLADAAQAAAAAEPDMMGSLDDVGKARRGLLDFVDKNTEVTIPNLVSFVPADSNPRINTVINDATVNRLTATFAGVLILMLASYILAAFALDNLNRDGPSMGALYALGVRRGELVTQYLMAPLTVVATASVVGTALGHYGAAAFNDFAQLTTYYSIPPLTPRVDSWAMVFGLTVAPLLVTIVVGLRVRNKLSHDPLQLLRRGVPTSRVGQNLAFEGWSFKARFRTRQTLREGASYVVIFLGLLLAIVLMVFGLGMRDSIQTYADRVRDDLSFSYMYLLQVPPKDPPAGGETAVLAGLRFGDEAPANITLVGVQPRSKYFPVSVETRSSSEVVISNAIASRYGVAEGDTVVFTDPVSGRAYRLRVAGVVPYAPGLYAFQSVASTRTLLGEESGYFNAVITNGEMSYEEGRLATTISRNGVIDGVAKTVEVTEPVVYTLIILSVVIFFIVLGLLIRMIVDRDTYSISLMKALGYRESEVASLYLGNYLYVVLAATAVGIPLGMAVLAPVWSAIIVSMPMGAPFLLGSGSMLAIAGIAFLTYAGVYASSRIRLARVPVADVLKNRD